MSVTGKCGKKTKSGTTKKNKMRATKRGGMVVGLHTFQPLRQGRGAMSGSGTAPAARQKKQKTAKKKTKAAKKKNGRRRKKITNVGKRMHLPNF